jgi:uncharacterized protein YcbX
MAHVSGLFLYPVKSCRGHRVDMAAVDDYGFVGDRRFLIVSPEGQFFTQRQLPQMARIDTELAHGTLTIGSANAGSVTVPSSPAAAARTLNVTVWKDNMTADDCGDEAAAWLTGFLGTPARLVRMGLTYRRPIPARKIPATLQVHPFAQPSVSFADGFPFLVISEASLGALNDRLAGRGEESVPMNRFRPNLVVDGCEAFAEDGWGRFKIGEVVFHGATPCARCIVTTTDQETGERFKEPLRTLATFRRDAVDPTDVNFGRNLIHETKRGSVVAGSALEFT